MKPSNAWLVIAMGVLLILNMAGVIDILAGWAGWTLAILVLLTGIMKLIKIDKK